MPASHSHTPTLRRHMNGQTNGNVSENTKDTSFLHDNPSINLLQQQEGTREWEAEQRRAKDFYDDGTISFFWRAHRITVLILFVCALVYITLFDEVKHNFEYNAKRGLVAVVLVFVLFGVVHTPDGPFRRPHPAFWRLLLCTSVVYELSLVFLLFQTVDDARMLLKNLDPELGRTLPEKSYGGNCLLYDIGNPSDPYHNIWDKMDGFVAVHFFGWWLKTLILRDYWLCFVMSIMFEVLEYTLEHQLPNFSECWWDHWLMDGLICNTLGIYLGMMTLKYLSMKPYHWRGMWNIPSYTGKISRILKQFTPYCWTDFDWRPTSSLKRWLTMLFIISMFLLAELNTFYLKFVLWIPPPHFLCLGRLFFMLGLGAVVMREVYEFLDNPKCFEMAYQTWVVAAIIVTELLIVVKFDLPTVTLPLPLHIKYAWSIGIAGLLMYTIWHFYLKRLLYHTEQRISTPARKKHAAAASAKNNNNSKNVDHHDYYHRNTGRATTVQGHKGKHKH